MKLINQSATLLPQDESLEGVFRQIELAARTCYKSEDRITPASAKHMVETLIKSKHTAMLEHGTIYLSLDWYESNYVSVCDRYKRNPYSVVKAIDGTFFITTNYRVIIENHWEKDLRFICSPTKHHEKRYTIRVITNLQVSHELVRHK